MWNNDCGFLKNLKTELPQLPRDPDVDYLETSKQCWERLLMGSMNIIVTAVLVTIAIQWTPPNCPRTDDWENKLWWHKLWNAICPKLKGNVGVSYKSCALWHTQFTERSTLRLQERFGGEWHLLFLQRTWVWVPVPMWRLIVFNSNSRWSKALFWPLCALGMHRINMSDKPLHAQNKNKSFTTTKYWWFHLAEVLENGK